jgi:CRISPR-associated protein Csd2
MALRELIVFKHSSELGDAPAHKLFELVDVKLRDGVTAPRAYSDYIVSVDREAAEAVGVKVDRKV